MWFFFNLVTDLDSSDNDGDKGANYDDDNNDGITIKSGFNMMI